MLYLLLLVCYVVFVDGLGVVCCCYGVGNGSCGELCGVG